MVEENDLYYQKYLKYKKKICGITKKMLIHTHN